MMIITRIGGTLYSRSSLSELFCATGAQPTGHVRDAKRGTKRGPCVHQLYMHESHHHHHHEHMYMYVLICRPPVTRCNRSLLVSPTSSRTNKPRCRCLGRGAQPRIQRTRVVRADNNPGGGVFGPLRGLPQPPDVADRGHG